MSTVGVELNSPLPLDDHSGASHEARLFKSKKSQAQTLECLEALLKATFQIDNVVGCAKLSHVRVFAP